jgi:transcriptional regulator with XRE-family HTH domain
MRNWIQFISNENQSGRIQEYGPFFKPDNTSMGDEGGDAGAFWQRFKDLSGKDLPVILKTNIKQSTISTWRRRKEFPRADEAVKIAETLHTSVEYLVTGRDKAYAPCSPAALKIAVAADKLDDEGKRIALAVIKGLESQYPLENSRSAVRA